MFVAPEPIQVEAHQMAHRFIQCLKDERYDEIWHQLLSLESINLMSTAIFPGVFGESSTDRQFLTYEIIESMSFAFQTDVVVSSRS